MIIIFEGPNAVGKTTLKYALANLVNDHDTCVDRLFVSDIVYAALRRNPQGIHRKLGELHDLNKHQLPFYVFVTLSTNQIAYTMTARGEQFSVDAIIAEQTLFNAIYDGALGLYAGKMELKRDNRSVDECVHEILEHVEAWRALRKGMGK